MKKKILIFLLGIVFFAIPIMVFAGPGTSPNNHDIELALPEIGSHPPYAVDDEYITITSQSWENETDHVTMSPDDVFEENKKYYYSMNYDKKQDFNGVTVYYQNNSPYSLGGGSASGPDSGTVGWRFYMGSLDHMKAVTGDVIIPDNTDMIKNGKLQMPNLTINEEKISNYSAYWLDSDNHQLSEDYSVESGKVYKYVIRLTASYKMHSSFDVVNNNIGTNLDESYEYVSSSISIGTYQYDATYSVSYRVIPPKQYHIIFLPNSGNFLQTGIIEQDIIYTKETSLHKNVYTKYGYSFKEWNTSEDGNGDSYNDEEAVLKLTEEDNLLLYAIWEPKPFQIIFDSNGGEGTMNNQQMINGVEAILNTNQFTKTGYYFSHWSESSVNFGHDFNDNDYYNLFVDTETITLYAIWEPIEFYVNYHANGGSGTMDRHMMRYDSGYNILATNSFTKEAYIFQGWNTKADGTGTSLEPNANIYNYTNLRGFELNLYAIWEPISYTIRFHSNNGNGIIKDQQVLYDDDVILLKNTFTYTNKSFIGWSTSANNSTIAYEDEDMVINLSMINGGIVNLYAQWKNLPREPIISYTTHVENIGWQQYVSNGDMAGTSGRGLRLEGIKIKVNNNDYDGNIEYRTHIENLGWENEYKKNDDMSGTSGRGLRLEAIQIKLTGDIADYYDVYYRVHAENFGWLGWARNGEEAGTSGYAYRLEGINIRLVKKDDSIVDYGDSIAFKDRYAVDSITLNKDNITLEVNEEEQLSATISPESANNKSLTWTSSNMDVATVVNGKVKAIAIGNAVITAISSNGKKDTCNVVVVSPIEKIEYTAHVENIGWQGYAKNGDMAGTSGRGLQLEGIKIRLKNYPYEGNVEYRTHIENLGWENEFKKNDEMSGTSGRGLQLEALEIKLTGEMKDHYDVYYRVHASNFGWLGWARNGESAGTAGYAYQLEAVEIKLLEKGQELPGYGDKESFNDRYAVSKVELNKSNLSLEVNDEDQLDVTVSPSYASTKTITWTSSDDAVATVVNGKIKAISIGNAVITATSNNGKKATCNVEVTPPVEKIEYTTHVENIGWQSYVKNGDMAGTSGRALRLEGIKIRLKNYPYDGDVEYRTHIENIGWEDGFKKNDEMSGTSGRALRLEAIEIKLTGEMKNHYDIYYRVHASNFGWLSWAKNGESSGTAGYGYRLEGIEIVLVNKGENPPARNNQNNDQSFIERGVIVTNYSVDDSKIVNLMDKLVNNPSALLSDSYSGFELFSSNRLFTVNEIRNAAVYYMVTRSEFTSPYRSSFSLDEMNAAVRKYFGNYNFDPNDLGEASCSNWKFDSNANTFNSEGGCGASYPFSTSYKIVSASDKNGTLDINLKVVFYQRDSKKYYSDYDKTNEIGQEEDDLEDLYELGARYKFKFKLENGNYVFVSSEPIN